MSRISDIKDEIEKIGSIEDYHKVQEKIAKLRDEHEENKSTSIWYMMEGTEIEDLEKLLDDKYRELERGENQKNEEIIVEEKQGEDDKEESSFLDSEDSVYNQVRNKYGNRPDSSETTEIKMESIDSYIVKEKMRKSKIRDEIEKIESIEDYHNVQGKLAELKDEHEKNISTSFWYKYKYMREGFDIEALEELLDKKYNQLKESKKDEEIIVEEKQVEEDKEENSFPESEVNSKENYKKGLDTWITEMENKIEKAQTLEELKKLRLEAFEKEEEGKKYGVERENLKRVRKIYSKCRNKSKEIEKTENTKVAEKSAQKPADSMYDQFLDSAR